MKLTEHARRLFRRVPATWWLGLWTLFLLAAVGAMWMVCPVWLTGKESASTTIRNLGLVVAAAVGLPLAIWRSIVAQRQAEASQQQSETAFQALLHDRFCRAAEALGHSRMASRIGGVNTLARLGGDHPETFHFPVIRLLSAFVVDRTATMTGGVPEQARDTATTLADEPSRLRRTPAGHSSEVREHASRDESSLAEDSGPFLAADRQVGPVPRLTKDVEEAMLLLLLGLGGQPLRLEHAGDFRVDLSDAFLPGLHLHGANLSHFDFTNADLRRVRGWGARFANAVLPGADLSGGNLAGADFSQADMRRVNLIAARLVGAKLNGADLSPVDWVADNLWRGRLFSSRLVGAQLHGAELIEANLTGADLRGISAVGANLNKSNLQGTDLREANLTTASCSEAKFVGANMRGTIGKGADLAGADLTGADLANAKLGSANFAGAFLSGANVTNADFSRDLPTGSVAAFGLFQEQLDEARADRDLPPILDGVVDSKTGRALVWEGRDV